MTTLIKLGAQMGVQSFSGQAARPLARAEPDPNLERIADLERELAKLRSLLKDAREDIARLTEEARVEGHRAGLAQARDDANERVEALRGGIKRAVASFETRLEALEMLAPQLAHAALEKLFRSGEQWAAMTGASLDRQLRLLRRDAIVAVYVSPADFAEDADLSALADELGLSRLILTQDRQLRAGACRIEARLGEVEIDLQHQWEKLEALLTGMAHS